VRVRARSYAAEGSRRAAKSPEAARRGAAAEDITITYLAGIPPPPFILACAPVIRARARRVCLLGCVRRCVHPRHVCGAGACDRRRGDERERKQPGLLQTEEI